MSTVVDTVGVETSKIVSTTTVVVEERVVTRRQDYVGLRDRSEIPGLGFPIPLEGTLTGNCVREEFRIPSGKGTLTDSDLLPDENSIGPSW